MIIKKDKIFYSACGIFIIGVLLAIMGYDLALLFIVGAYLLRPTLHAFDLAIKYADERQTQIQGFKYALKVSPMLIKNFFWDSCVKR